MAVIKHHFGPFTTVSNRTVRDLEPEALGVLVKMLSFPPNWKFSREMLMKACGIKRHTLDRVLKILKDYGVLAVKSVQVEGKMDGWEWHVSSEPMGIFSEDDTPPATDETPADSPTVGKSDSRENRQSENQTVYKETVRNKETKNNKETISRRGTRLTDDWEPSDDLLLWAYAKGMTPEWLAREFEKFKNYWMSVAGNRGLKLDWYRTAQNWLLSAQERMPKNKPAPARASLDAADEALRRVEQGHSQPQQQDGLSRLKEYRDRQLGLIQGGKS